MVLLRLISGFPWCGALGRVESEVALQNLTVNLQIWKVFLKWLIELPFWCVRATFCQLPVQPSAAGNARGGAVSLDCRSGASYATHGAPL